MSVTQGGRTDFNGTVSVNNFASASASACLDLTSTTQGMLPPRMTTTQQNAISTPAQGLTIYNTSTNLLSTYNGTAWQQVGPVLISSSVLGSAQANVTFSSIPATFNNLYIRILARGDNASSTTNLNIQLNGDTTSSYYIYDLFGNNNVATSFGTGATFTSGAISQLAAASNTANVPTIVTADIIGYASTTFYKSIQSVSTTTAATVANSWIILYGTTWTNTTAVNSIKLFPAAGNFVTGSAFYLYGTM
jgi:hypothetical protein